MKRVLDTENSASSLAKGSVGKKISRSLSRHHLKRGTASSMKNETEVSDAALSSALAGYPSRVSFQNFVDAGVARSQAAVGMSKDDFTGLLEDAIVFGVSQDVIDAFENYKVNSFGEGYDADWSEVDDVRAFAEYAPGDARRQVFEYIRAEAPEVLVQYGKYLTGIKSKYRLGDSAKVSDAAGSRIAELYPLYFANSGEAEDSLLAIRSGNLYYLYDDSAAVVAGVLGIPLQGFSDEDGYHSCVVLSESQLAQAEAKFGDAVVYSAPVVDSAKVKDGVYYPKGRATAGPAEGNYRYVNILNDDSEFFDLCIHEGWIDADTPIEEFDALAVFEGNPDMLKVDGETGYFLDVEEDGQRTVYYWLDDYSGKGEEILRAFYTNRLEAFDSSEAIQNWEAWDSITDGVVYRGGMGYVYAIYEYIGGSESTSVTDSADDKALEEAVSFVVVRTAESEFPGSSASVNTEFEQSSVGYYVYLSVELETTPELEPNLEASEDFFDAVGKALGLSSSALQPLVRHVAVSAEETRWGDYVAFLTSETWLSKLDYDALVKRLQGVSDSDVLQQESVPAEKSSSFVDLAVKAASQVVDAASKYRYVDAIKQKGVLYKYAKAEGFTDARSLRQYDPWSFFEGETNLIKVDGIVAGAFAEEVVDGKPTVFYYITTRESDAVRLLREFYEDRGAFALVSHLWSDFDRLRTGIFEVGSFGGEQSVYEYRN